MSIYIALLRGINVGGHKRIKMDALRTSFARLGITEAKTYLQSGNVVFDHKKIALDELSSRVAAQIEKDFGFEVSVICRTVETFATTISRNPFLSEPGIDPKTLHVAFLSLRPKPAALGALKNLPAGADRFHCSGSEIYLHCPGGYADTKFSNLAIEKLLSVRSTTRNWNTTTSLHKLAQEML